MALKSIEQELSKWAEMNTKNFCTNDAIYLRSELNYYTEIVVDLNKVQFLFGHLKHVDRKKIIYIWNIWTVVEDRVWAMDSEREREIERYRKWVVREEYMPRKIGSNIAECNNYT